MRHYAPWLQKRNFDMIDQIRGSWNLIKETIRNEYDLSDISFSTWIEPLQFADLQDDMVVILIPSDQSHALNYISSKYKNYFKVTISEMFDHTYDVKFILEKDKEIEEKELKKPSYNINDENANLNPKYRFDNFFV